MQTAIVNAGMIISGDWRAPFIAGDGIIMANGCILAVGDVAGDARVEASDVIIDAGGAAIMPGLIDSQVHNTFGDYTPRQKTVGFLESYVHGGVTTAISASEVHVPGRPRDPDGVKALAIAAQRSFATYRPGGMRVYGGSVILEPGLVEADFHELKAKGVWLAKAGFGNFASPFDYAPLARWAREAGMITTLHTGGASIPDSSPIWGDHVLAINPHVSFHINGGPTAIPDGDIGRIITESDIALQVCTAGNLRTTLLCAELAIKAKAFDRFLIATDTPTGSGVMPLGMLYTISHLASLTAHPPEWFICAATGSNANVYGLSCGILAPGREADVVVLDAPTGGTQDNVIDALRNGDIPGIGAVISAGEPRFVGQSRNTPAPRRRVRVAKNTCAQSFVAARY